MAHILVLVAGDSPAHELAPFHDALEVAPYRRECYCRRRFDGNRHHFVSAATPGCAWCRASGELEVTTNPIGQWDSFIATNGELSLVPGASRRPLDAREMHAGRYSAEQLAELARDVDRVRRGDVVELAALVPYALVIDGLWHQDDDRSGRWFPSLSRYRQVVFASDWPAAYGRLVAQIPADTMISLVDCHC